MNITSAQYIVDKEGNNESVKANINGVVWFIPTNDETNRHWQAVQEWVADGNTIAEAD